MPTEVETIESGETVGFACALCGKSFARRDLRNRHRRRCERSINKVKVSKKRSCEACGKSKLKCDLQQPACGRCQGRGMPCQYPNDTAAQVAQQNAMRNASVSSVSTDLSFMSEDFLNGAFQASAPSTAPITGYNTPIHVNPLAGEQSPVFATVMDDMLLDGFSADPESFSRSSTGFWDSTSFGLLSNDMNMNDPYSQSCNLPNDFSLSALNTIPDDYEFAATKAAANPFGGAPMSLDHHMPIRSMSTGRQDESYPGSVFDLDTTPSNSPAATLPDNLQSMMTHSLGGNANINTRFGTITNDYTGNYFSFHPS